MTAQEILNELKALGSDSYKRVIFKHGVAEPCYGVKIGDMQKIVKRIKKDYKLALALYDTGVYDAMYLAGLIADDAKMTKKDLMHWLKQAYCRPLAGWTVAWVAAGSPNGWDMALEWIDSKETLHAVAGWATLASVVSVKSDEDLDLKQLKSLVKRVQNNIHQEADEVRYHMNAFLISLGSYVEPLLDEVLKAAEKIGPVTADLGDNNCKTPNIAEYIAKVEKRGAIGKKRKTAKC
jgi:3-methyladenine DNA glycosylase AlkD